MSLAPCCSSGRSRNDRHAGHFGWQDLVWPCRNPWCRSPGSSGALTFRLRAARAAVTQEHAIIRLHDSAPEGRCPRHRTCRKSPRRRSCPPRRRFRQVRRRRCCPRRRSRPPRPLFPQHPSLPATPCCSRRTCRSRAAGARPPRRRPPWRRPYPTEARASIHRTRSTREDSRGNEQLSGLTWPCRPRKEHALIGGTGSQPVAPHASGGVERKAGARPYGSARTTTSSNSALARWTIRPMPPIGKDCRFPSRCTCSSWRR